MVVRLPQKLEHKRGCADRIEVLPLRVFLRLIALRRAGLVDFYFGRKWHFPDERAIINFHCQQLHGMSLRVGRLRQLARAANHHAPWFNGEVDDGAINSCQIDADPNACLAAVRIDGWLPGMCKSGKLRTRRFVGNIVQCTMEPAQLYVPDWVHRKLNFYLVPSIFNYAGARQSDETLSL